MVHLGTSAVSICDYCKAEGFRNQENRCVSELAEIYRDGDTTELFHYRVRFGDRDIVLVISQIHHGWRVVNLLEVEG